jgi:hypothetical protein
VEEAGTNDAKSALGLTTNTRGSFNSQYEQPLSLICRFNYHYTDHIYCNKSLSSDWQAKNEERFGRSESKLSNELFVDSFLDRDPYKRTVLTLHIIDWSC